MDPIIKCSYHFKWCLHLNNFSSPFTSSHNWSHRCLKDQSASLNHSHSTRHWLSMEYLGRQFSQKTFVIWTKNTSSSWLARRFWQCRTRSKRDSLELSLLERTVLRSCFSWQSKLTRRCQKTRLSLKCMGQWRQNWPLTPAIWTSQSMVWLTVRVLWTVSSCAHSLCRLWRGFTAIWMPSSGLIPICSLIRPVCLSSSSSLIWSNSTSWETKRTKSSITKTWLKKRQSSSEL